MTFTDNSFFDGEEEEATDDYSSYWQSIPSPPAAAAPSAVEVAVGKKPTVEPVAEEGQQRTCRNRKRSNAFRDVTNHQEVLLNGAESDSLEKPAAASAAALEGDAGIDEVLRADHSGDETVEKKRKKRKRRQRRSMLLPSDIESGAGNPLSCSGENTPHDEDMDVTPKLNGEQSDNLAEGLHETQDKRNEVLIQLVRNYCSLPPDTRVNSKEAKEIESLSGYPMPGKVLPVMNDATSKEEFLLRVQPIVQEMENRKQRDVADTQSATQCVAKRDGRGGYSYYDINSGDIIPAEEYKRRYTAMIDEKRKERKNKGCVEQCSERASDCLANKGANNGKVDRRSIDSSFEQGNSDDSNMDESVNMDDSMMSLDDSVVVHEDEKQHSSTTTRRASFELKLNVSPTEPRISLESEGSPTNNTGGTAVETQNEVVIEPSHNDESSPNSHPLLAGMPTSNDPRVLAARRKLWRAIDTALADYSQEILAIEQSGDVGEHS